MALLFLSRYRSFILFAGFALFALIARSQSDTTIVPRDTSSLRINSDAVYNRPFLQMKKFPVALGGYVEANTAYSGTDGVSEGLSFQFRRLTIFMSSTIKERIRFLSEIEFEDGTKEINIEFAALDFEFHPMLTLRGGIILNPIGAFNQNHDGPKWEFVDRPLSATKMLPATWSNVGFGLMGKHYGADWVFGYEAYLTNGFDDRIIGNNQNKTFLPASKENKDRFEESFNGEPMFTGKVTVRKRKFAEIGLSYMGGIYNRHEEDGLRISDPLRMDVYAIDFNSVIGKTSLTGEFAWVNVQLPSFYSPLYGKRQRGGFLDVVQPLYSGTIFGWKDAVLNVALRLEHVDWNIGKFEETGGEIADDIYAISPALSFRPGRQTVIRLNYRYEWQTDFLGNPPSRTAAIHFGFSSYF